MVDFLVDDALNNQKHRVSITYLWIEKSTNKLLCYITLLCDSLRLSGQLKTFFRTKNILYKSLPAVKIGRLCVADRYLQRGLGKLMTDFTIWKVKQLNENPGVGCRFITLDAKRNVDPKRDSMHFYKKMSFKILRDRMKGTVPMYKDIYKILEYSNSKKKT